ncbi:MAG: hypothetical protein MGU50_15460 [Trichodesmium sp. MAG_R02]|jgi:hypothetical protein|nr:hypothetical protein [Trichodesmium sp. MAG_R02]
MEIKIYRDLTVRQKSLVSAYAKLVTAYLWQMKLSRFNGVAKIYRFGSNILSIR